MVFGDCPVTFDFDLWLRTNNFSLVFKQRLKEMYNRLCFLWYQICCWIVSRFSEFWITGRVITSCKSARSSVTVAPSGNFIRELRSLIRVKQNMETLKMAKNQNGKNPERQKTKTEKKLKGKGLIRQIETMSNLSNGKSQWKNFYRKLSQYSQN